MKKIFILFFLLSKCIMSQECNYALNSSFDSINVAGTTVALINASLIPGWQTTATDNKIEVWANGYNGINSYSGIQFIEMNGTMPATLFQTITVTPGTSLTITFAHRGRGGIDTVGVSAGPIGGPYTSLGKFGDGQSAWGTHTVNYVVPNLGNQYAIRFTSVYWAFGNAAVGNLLDAVKICSSSNATTEPVTDSCNYTRNGGFDSLNVAGTTVALANSSLVPLWNTTATDNIIEVWANGYNGINSHSGIQFIEMNGTMPATLFQTVTATPGTTLSISFAHRGRGGIDSISVSAGPIGGPYAVLGKVGDGQSSWGTYTLTYVVPNSGNQYSIRFNTVYWAFGNPAIGNFLDAVKTCGQENRITTALNTHAKKQISSVYPNPSKADIYFKFAANTGSEKELLIYNSQGQLIRQIHLGAEPTYTLEKDQMSNGIYYYTIRNATFSESGKFVFCKE